MAHGMLSGQQLYGRACRADHVWSRVVLRFVAGYTSGHGSAVTSSRRDGEETEEEGGNSPLSDVVGLVSSRLENTSGPFPRTLPEPFFLAGPSGARRVLGAGRKLIEAPLRR